MGLPSWSLKKMNFFLFIAFSLREMSFIQMFSRKFSLVASFALREFAQSNKIPWTWLLFTEQVKDATVEALKGSREGIQLWKHRPPRGKCKNYLFMGLLRVHEDMKHLRGLESTKEARNALRDISFNLFCLIKFYPKAFLQEKVQFFQCWTSDHSPEYYNDEISGWWWLRLSCCTYPMAAAHIRVFLFWRHLPLSCMKNTWVRLGRQTHTRRCFEPQLNWSCWCLNRKTFLLPYSSATFHLWILDRDLCLERSGLFYNLSQRK